MADTFSPAVRSQIMARVHSRDTSAEMAVRRALYKEGYRFRLHKAGLPGKPDVVLARYRTIVMVHGCLWHGHGCKRFRWPQSNKAYWQMKIKGNMERDAANIAALAALGWRVRVIWECELPQGIAALLTALSA